MNYEYREGKDYSLCKSINTGSYGEVHSVQDNRTHFRFGAKKVQQHLHSLCTLSVCTLSVCYLSLLITIELSSPSPSSQILLKSFSSEEVGTWSALKSPRVVELFGVIREGPYVVLFMDLKAGELYTILYLDLRQ